MKTAEDIKKTALPVQSRQTRRWDSRRRQTVVGYLFLAPTLLFFAVFLVVPLGFSLFISFSSWSGFDLTSIEWVGLQNYKDILSKDSAFLTPILTNTLYFAFGTVLLSFVAAVIVAYMITRLKFEGFWRTLYFLPMVTTVVAVGNVWKFMYDPNGGLINAVLNRLGMPTIAFLDNPDTALTSIVVVSAWAAIGSAVLILTAGLKGIPESYYEAAELEGASVSKMFWHITLPLLRPSMLFVLITGLISGLQSFTLTMVMTGDGGPGNATNVGGLEMYNQAFQYSAWGIACAMAFILFIIVFVVTAIQLMIFRRGGVESY